MTNPYSPPRVDELQPQLQRGAELEGVLQDAPLGTRFANVLLDTVFRLVLTVCVGMVFGSFHLKGPIVMASTLLTGFAYSFFFEWALGRTLAKYITRTRVV